MSTNIHAAGSTGLRSPGLDAAIAAWHADNPDTGELRGTGMPNGVVTASPGTYYTDTAGTNGAWRWLKTSGTGNTGWTVIVGDTGWRNIASLLQNGWTAVNMWIKRENGTAYLHADSLAAESATNSVVLVLPTGYRSLTGSPGYLRGSFQIPDGTSRRVAVDNRLLLGSYSASDVLSGTLTMPGAGDAWPTTLPGTAV